MFRGPVFFLAGRIVSLHSLALFAVGIENAELVVVMKTTEKILGSVPRRSVSKPERCRRMFLKFFPRGFHDEKYFSWERGYKISAHEQWHEQLNRKLFRQLLKNQQFAKIATIATRIESRTNLLFSFEKMALRDAVREPGGAEMFATGLYDLLYGRGADSTKFDKWCETVGRLPRKQTRVLTHPVVTVFPFIAEPENHIFLKPNVTKSAAEAYGFEFEYNSTPSWKVYSQLLLFAEILKGDLSDLAPRDMIDIQSFMWVIGSDEYKSMTP